jgi:SAM-dependent methyltransferase
VRPDPGKRDGPGPEWFEDEGFWTDYAQIMFDEDRWAEVPAVVDSIEALAKPPRGASVLDACCGPGRHSLELASRGYRVTGIDITGSYLEAARESAAAWGLAAARDRGRGSRRGAAPGAGSADFVRADVRRIRLPRRFDLAINLYTSFGYFRDRRDDLAALRSLRRSLRPGGKLVLEMNGKETAVRDYVSSEEFDRGGWRVRTENEVVGAWEGMRFRWILTRGAERVDRSFTLRLYSGTELRGALAEAGFSEMRICGGLDGSPYDHDARSLVALAGVPGGTA